VTGILSALRTYERSNSTAVIVLRTDHPHVDGDYYYAIQPADKHAWTDGERQLTADEITDLWYEADCPRFTPQQTYFPEFANLSFVPA
jgi:hypothetical protein